MTRKRNLSTSQKQEKNVNTNDNDEKIYPKPYTLCEKLNIIFYISVLGTVIFFGWPILSQSPIFYFFIIPLLIFVGFLLIYSVRARKNKSQNLHKRKETAIKNYNLSTTKNSQEYCFQCGNEVNRNIDLNSVYYCSRCGYEIKNTRG